ncbi:RNA polymerase sigma factor, partial [Planctomycetota bacterium]
AKQSKALDTPIAQAIRTEELEAVRKGLEQMEESLLGPIVLRYWLDLNSLEIGEILQLNPATVRSRLRQGRLNLAEQLVIKE